MGLGCVSLKQKTALWVFALCVSRRDGFGRSYFAALKCSKPINNPASSCSPWKFSKLESLLGMTGTNCPLEHAFRWPVLDRTGTTEQPRIYVSEALDDIGSVESITVLGHRGMCQVFVHLQIMDFWAQTGQTLFCLDLEFQSMPNSNH